MLTFTVQDLTCVEGICALLDWISGLSVPFRVTVIPGNYLGYVDDVERRTTPSGMISSSSSGVVMLICKTGDVLNFDPDTSALTFG